MDSKKNAIKTEFKNPFDKLTNLYELSKTLRFELKPMPETKELLEKGEGKNLIQMDQEIDQLYEKEMKPMFDDLHEKFITESLSAVKIDDGKLKKIEGLIKEMEDLRKQIKEARKNESNVDEAVKRLKEIEGDQGKNKNGEIVALQNELRGIIIKAFNDAAKKWKDGLNGKEVNLLDKKGKKKITIKKDGPEILQEENVLAILAHFNPEKAHIIKKFIGFFTYFSGFNQSRANYYTKDAKTTGVANRAINKNLLIFLENRKDFKRFKERLSHLSEFNEYFKLENYEKYLSQTGIEIYNEQIGKIKQIVNLEHNQKQVDNKFQLKGLKTLEKQIGCKAKKQREENGEGTALKYLEKVGLGFQVAKNDNGEYLIWECLDYINKSLEKKLKGLKKNYQRFFDNWQEYNLEKIWFRKEAINTISGRWFGGSNWFIIGRALSLSGVGKIDKRENAYKIPEFVSLQEIKTALENLEQGIDFDLKKKRKKKDMGEEKIGKEIKYSAENLFKEEYKEKGLFKNTLFETMLAVWQSEVELKLVQIFDGREVKIENKDGKEEAKWAEAFIKEFEKYSQEKFDRSIKDESGRSTHTEVVKNLIEEGYLRLFQLTKYHNLDKKNERTPLSVDENFYSILDDFWTDNIIVTYHKALQATLTKKPYSENKIKLYFENPTLAQGFDINKETDNMAVIIRDGIYYYLAIMGKGNNYSFSKEKNQKLYENINSKWQKMEYKYLPDVSKMIPKVTTQRKDVVAHFKKCDDDYLLYQKKKFNKPLKISKEIFELNNRIYLRTNLSEAVIRDKASENDEKKYVKIFQKDYYAKCGGNYEVYQKALEKWIDFCKTFLACYKSCEFFNFSSLNEAKNYDSLDKFYFDVDRLCYMKKFVAINYQELNKLINERKIYLFKIYNKDFSDNKVIKLDGSDNLETIILKSLFSENNLKSRKIKLNGRAELFFRKASINYKEEGQKIDKERSKTFNVIVNKRYTEDKYFFHFPLTINFGAKVSQAKQFNNNISEKIHNNNFNILGIDRGEKHLLYYSVINPEGKLLEQGSFNRIETKSEVDGKEVKVEYDEHDELKKVELVATDKKVKYVDYRVLLDYYEKKRNLARRDWQTIGKIKDLKDGYLSQVVHKIYQLILKYNAVVVMEDLNVEFKAKRAAKVEKSVYKNFEITLAKKLNHLILKDRRADEIGGALNAYQLTPAIPANDVGKFDNAKQWGIIFYVRANYTSITDPLTGWRKQLYIGNKDNQDKIREFFNPDTGVKIDYDINKQCFKFSYDQEFEIGEKKHWKLFAYDGLERFYWDNKERIVKKYNLFIEFEQLFSNLDKSKNINIQIDGANEFNWKNLVFFWNLLNQIRNTNRNEQGGENDFLQSPVWSEKYTCFYDSRRALEGMPNNGDANGAFNIARKGLIILNRIKKCSDVAKFGNDNNGKNPENGYFISDHDWDKFTQSPK